MFKTILSIIAVLIIALFSYIIWQDASVQLQERSEQNRQTADMQTVQAPALADDTLASVDIDSKTTTILDERKRILVLGDSLTAGYGIVLEKSWLHLLEQELNSSAENRYRLINAGISGDTTGGGLARLPQALEQHKPEVVIVELGGNDGLRGYPVKNIRDNLSKIIATVKATGAKVVLAGIQIPPNYGQRYTETFAAIYPQLAKEQNVPLIPFILDGVALKEEWMQQDGIHPNEDGQEQIKNNVLSSLTKVLE